jgi:hypothetical protein
LIKLLSEMKPGIISLKYIIKKTGKLKISFF